MNELKKEEVLISETQTDVEDNNELDNTSDDDGNISKSTRIKYAILGLSYFIAILLSNIALIFKPLYKRVYYRQANGHFRYGIGILILIALICVIKKVIQPKLGLNPIKDKRPFTWKKTLFIFGLTYLVIFIILFCITLPMVMNINSTLTKAKKILKIIPINILVNLKGVNEVLNLVQNNNLYYK